MSTRLTLLFICDRSYLYSSFINEFRAADFQVLIARNLTLAKSILLTRPLDGVVLCHDCSRDDRPQAGPLKRLAPRVPIFLLTDQEQSRHADIDCVWRSDLGDKVLTRGMAVFLHHILNLRDASRRLSLVIGGTVPFFAGVRANGSH